VSEASKAFNTVKSRIRALTKHVWLIGDEDEGEVHPPDWFNTHPELLGISHSYQKRGLSLINLA